MSLIVAATTKDNEIVMASDSGVYNSPPDAFWTTSATPKIVSRNGILVGATGDVRVQGVLERDWQPFRTFPEYLASILPDQARRRMTQIQSEFKTANDAANRVGEYHGDRFDEMFKTDYVKMFVSTIVRDIRQLMQSDADTFLESEKMPKWWKGTELLIGVQGRLFTIAQNFGIVWESSNVAAIGYDALGATAVLRYGSNLNYHNKRNDLDGTITLVRSTLATLSQISAGCRDPYFEASVECLPTDEIKVAGGVQDLQRYKTESYFVVGKTGNLEKWFRTNFDMPTMAESQSLPSADTAQRINNNKLAE